NEKMSPAPYRPCLRPGLSAEQDRDPRYLHVWDRLRLADRVLRVDRLEFAALQLFDGTRTLPDVQAAVARQAGAGPVPPGLVADLAARLDAALFLDGPRFRARLDAPVREPACVGCYPADPDGVRRQLRGL